VTWGLPCYKLHVMPLCKGTMMMSSLPEKRYNLIYKSNCNLTIDFNNRHENFDRSRNIRC
jgi:hypothetical protein